MIHQKQKEVFLRLSENSVCYYIDYKTISKKKVYEITRGFDLKDLLKHKNTFIVHTCLRLEIYNFDAINFNFQSKDFCVLHNKLALRRLISLSAGLQSEIIGETEIYGQVKNGIVKSLENKCFDKKIFWDLIEVLDYAKEIREKYNINCTENYSTVGADLFNSIMKNNTGVISVIGSGYMAEYFLRRINFKNSKKFYWINRNTSKAKDLQKKFGFLNDYDIEHVCIDDCSDILKNSDFIFAATTNTASLFSGLILKKPKAIVDVSYPSLFSEYTNPNLYCINNTFFEKHVVSPVCKKDLLYSEKEIDSIFFEECEFK